MVRQTSQFARDTLADLCAVIVLLLSDGVMCGLTGVSWVIQKLVFRGWLDWDDWGWIVQNVRLIPWHLGLE